MVVTWLVAKLRSGEMSGYPYGSCKQHNQPEKFKVLKCTRSRFQPKCAQDRSQDLNDPSTSVTGLHASAQLSSNPVHFANKYT